MGADLLDGQEFYERCQAYRNAPVAHQADVVSALNELKAWLRRNFRDAGIDLGPARPTFREARDQSERRLIVDALERSRGNISRASRALDISRPTFHGMLAKHNIDDNIDAKSFRVEQEGQVH